ncbi:rhamnan synthesis F family protein [Salinicola sp. RZ23]|uniref:rhamnan synthesis F family protein n=1 Tax=Salinicola sp. RZ23 TaxID=1949087 RepID=UPI000DA20276|nr:rhamnan synthesis F family protein [Salinicola sp. RZ23]
MKPEGKVTALLPWLFQAHLLGRARRRRPALEDPELVVDAPALEPDPALVDMAASMVSGDVVPVDAVTATSAEDAEALSERQPANEELPLGQAGGGDGHAALISQAFIDALSTGLFDPKWYQATYGLRFATQREAFDDYLRKSRFAPVNPSPRFDSETYHRMYMDVFHAQQSPLQHYLLHGRSEGRQHAPATVRWHPRQIVTSSVVLGEAASTLKVALCLHVFYADFLDRFAEAIARFPIEVDVFLTLAAAEHEEKAQAAFAEHPRVRALHTRVVPNRGRNFGPMLVEFGPQLGEYDLLCHLHSKKSLYSGKEQTQWAEYLIEYLLRDVSVITRLLNAFAEDESLGLYYPTTFWMMPAWVNHQTMNKGFMQTWQRELGLGPIPDFLSYPAGGMFWARPQALRGVIDRGWAYDDFPPEPLPNDNSMLHALERVLGPLVEHRGYRQLFFYPPTGQFTTDSGYITASYHGRLSNHLASIQAHSYISFDVFDTLVRREYMVADYAKLKLGKQLAEQGRVVSARAFVKLRNEAEASLRQRANFQGDVDIVAIYDEIAERLEVSPAQAQAWMRQEFELDLEMIRPKDEMVELFNHLAASGHVLWVISDTYYTRDQVGLMLRKAGVSAAYRLMVSSAEQARKDNGSLWHKVKQDLAAEGVQRHLHIGDNVVADAQMPGDLGLTTFHILHPRDKWRALGFPEVLVGDEALDEGEILKWGRLISEVGRNPFIGE